MQIADKLLAYCTDYAVDCFIAETRALKVGARVEASEWRAKRLASYAIRDRLIAMATEPVCAHKWTRADLFSAKTCEQCGLVLTS